MKRALKFGITFLIMIISGNSFSRPHNMRTKKNFVILNSLSGEAFAFKSGSTLPSVTIQKQKGIIIPNALQELGTSCSHALFRSPPALGAGTDERFSTSFVNGRLEDQAALLTKVHMSFMQHSLLTDLMSDKYGMVEKLHKVQYASREQLLGSSYDYQWQPTSAHAGGLMNDWSFNME